MDNVAANIRENFNFMFNTTGNARPTWWTRYERYQGRSSKYRFCFSLCVLKMQV